MVPPRPDKGLPGTSKGELDKYDFDARRYKLQKSISFRQDYDFEMDSDPQKPKQNKPETQWGERESTQGSLHDQKCLENESPTLAPPLSRSTAV